MGNLTKNLSRWEFECPCGCDFDTVDFALASAMQASCDFFGKAFDVTMRIHVNSGNRCKAHNKTVAGASDKSQHVNARAADFYLWYYVQGKKVIVPADDVADYLDSQFPKTCGIGRYNGRTHFDTRELYARWDAR